MPTREVADILADVRDLVGSAHAALWVSNGAESPTLLEYSSRSGDEPRLDARQAGLLRWAAEQAPGETCTDGESPRFAATPVLFSDGALLVLTAGSESGALAMPRDGIRLWLPRLGKRLATIQHLVNVQAAGSRAERQADLLLITAAALQEHRTVEELGSSLCSAATHMTGARRAALVRWQVTRDSGEVAYVTRGHLVDAGAVVDSSSQVAAACRGELQVLQENLSDRGETLVVYGGEEPPRALGALAIIPLRGGEGVIGALVMEADEPTPISKTDAKNLRLLALMGGAALETLWEIEEINRRARTDALTGLANRQQFEERLTRIVAETNRFGGSCCLLVIDIDRFKHVNDTFGHQVGDVVLQRVASTLQREVRTVDLCARYGGEELAVLLPQTSIEGGAQLAERLRKAVAERVISVSGHDVTLTISLGVASYPEGAHGRDELFATADRALYQAKRSGRNRVVTIGA